MNSNENEININEIQINFNEVEINFNYESQNNIRIKCKLNEPIKQVLLQFSSKNKIDFDKLNFLTNGKLIEKSDYNEPTRKFLADLNLRKLTILVYNKVESEQARLEQHKEIVVVFWFRGNPTSIKSSINNKMKDIVELFGKKINEDFNQMNFNYMNKNMEFHKTINEIATQNDKDRRLMEIIVVQINENMQTQIRNTDENTQIQIEINDENTQRQIENNDENTQRQIENNRDRNEESCYTRNEKMIIISIIIIIIIAVFLIVLFKIILKKRKESEEENKDRCLSYIDSDSTICIKCKDEFELYIGKCVVYSFYAKYKANYLYEKVKLFNPKKSGNINAMKINEKDITSPISEYNFLNSENNIVLFYLKENNSNSLSNLFENITHITEFSFNDKYINDLIIDDIKSMFSGCISLTSLSFNSFKGKNIVDISSLFFNCNSLISIDLSSLTLSNLEDMNSLFFNCTSLIYLDISNLNTKKVTNMSLLFYNCYSLISLNIYKLDSQNVYDMSKMFYNCSALKSLDLKNLNTQNVNNMSEISQILTLIMYLICHSCLIDALL